MRGVITLVFDDGYRQVFSNVVPLLERLAVPAVFAVPLNGNGLEQKTKRRLQPWPSWLALKNAGHEIAAHSVTHRDLTTLKAQELADELAAPVQALQATTLVYPGGAHNEAVRAAAGKYYQAARTVKRGFESLPPTDAMQLKSFNFSKRNFSVWRANCLAVWAWLTNSWLIETYHMVDDHDRELVHSIATADLARHLKFVRKLPVAIKTITEVMAASD